MTTTTSPPHNDTNRFNTTLTTWLNSQFNSEYTNQSSFQFKSFANTTTTALAIAYKEIEGFQAVFVKQLTCQQKIAVKHIVVTSLRTNVKVMEAWLILANATSGYFQGMVVEANKACNDADGRSGGTSNTDDNNWVYMIVFVCITALLLLAMVCQYNKTSLPQQCCDKKVF